MSACVYCTGERGPQSALALALEDLLRRPVDLAPYASLHPRLRASVYAHYDELFSDIASNIDSIPSPASVNIGG